MGIESYCQKKNESLTPEIHTFVHKEIQDTKNELNELREENKSLKHKLEISEKALESSQVVNAKQGATIEQLMAETKCLKEQKLESKDEELLKKYQEILKEKEELAQIVAKNEASLDSN